MLTRYLAVSCLLVGLLAGSSCKSASMNTVGATYAQPLTMQSVEPDRRTVAIRWQDLFTRPEFDDIQKRFRQLAEERKYTIKDREEDADLVYDITLRYFGINPARDDGEYINKVDQNILGGDEGWMDDVSGTPYKKEGTIQARIIPKEPPAEVLSGDDEWVCLIDVVVGERRPGEKLRTRHAARLIAWVRQPELTTDTAAKKLSERIGETGLTPLLK